MLSFNSYGEWNIIGNWDNGDSAHIDLESLQLKDGYVYWWELKDFGEPIGDIKSVVIYFQGDCEMNRMKLLSKNYYVGQMGKGDMKSDNPSNPEWVYPPPGTAISQTLDLVCGIFDLS